MNYDIVISLFRHGIEWGLGLGSLAWIVGFGMSYTIKIFFHI